MANIGTDCWDIIYDYSNDFVINEDLHKLKRKMIDILITKNYCSIRFNHKINKLEKDFDFIKNEYYKDDIIGLELMYNKGYFIINKKTQNSIFNKKTTKLESIKEDIIFYKI